MDGLEFLKHVRSCEPPLRSVPVVLLTATKTVDDARRDCARAGATEFLTKPVSDANLFAVIEKYLSAQSAAR
jgi:CheY-like chemotaxis protein